MILNLTQHASTAHQQKAGVYDLEGRALKQLKELLTFESLPTQTGLYNRALRIEQLVELVAPRVKRVMIGGAPFFMAPLEHVLASYEILYAFSERISVDTVHADGTVTKTAVFNHAGFVVA